MNAVHRGELAGVADRHFHGRPALRLASLEVGGRLALDAILPSSRHSSAAISPSVLHCLIKPSVTYTTRVPWWKISGVSVPMVANFGSSPVSRLAALTLRPMQSRCSASSALPPGGAEAETLTV